MLNREGHLRLVFHVVAAIHMLFHVEAGLKQANLVIRGRSWALVTIARATGHVNGMRIVEDRECREDLCEAVHAPVEALTLCDKYVYGKM